MTQDFQSIGKASPALDELAAEKSGWQGDQPEPLIDQFTDQDTSQYNTRANTQALGRSIPNMAGHTETPAAAQPVTPFNPYQEDDDD